MNRVVGWTREALAQRVLIVAAVTAVLHLAVALHWVTNDWSDSAVKGVTGALDGVGVVVATLWARHAVTPVQDPRAGDGTPLVAVTRVIAEQPGAEPVVPAHVPEHASPED